MYTLYIKRVFAALCVFTMLLSQSACNGSIFSNYRKVDNLQLVQTMGVDECFVGPRVTISTGAGSKNVPAVMISREGESMVSAMESLQDYSAKEELYFSHTRFVLLGEASAKVRLDEILDYVERNTHIRMDTTPFVVRGGEAKNLIGCSGKENYEITETLSSIERDIKKSGDSYPYSFREVSRSLSEYGGALVCAVAGKKTEGSVYTESGELTAVPSGFAVIDDDRLTGFLDIDESRGANLLVGRYGFGSIVLELASDNRATLLPEKSSTKFTATFDDAGTLRQLLCEVRLEAGLTEMTLPLSLENPDEAAELNSALSKEIESWCSSVLLRSIEEECDFMGLLGILRRQYPKEIVNLAEPFETALKNAEISVRAEGSVKHSYNLDSPLEYRGEES